MAKFEAKIVAGMVAPGNVGLFDRPALVNKDGTVSTTLSFSVPASEVGLADHGEALLPQVIGGRKLTFEQAVAHARQTGEHLGIFRDAVAANEYAARLHEEQEASGPSAKTVQDLFRELRAKGPEE